LALAGEDRGMTMTAKAAVALDAAAVEQLTLELLAVVKGHYLRRPMSRDTAKEVLNAAAIVVATVFTAARVGGGEDEAREFFDLAVEQQMGEGSCPTTLGDLMRVVRKGDAS
jgi:hypothetical protein